MSASPEEKMRAAGGKSRTYRPKHANGGGDPQTGVPGDQPDVNDTSGLDKHELPTIRPKLYRLSERAKIVTLPMAWFCEDWIPAQQVTGIYGLAAKHKTWLLQQALMARSRGLIFLGRQLEARPTLGMFCEDTQEELDRRADLIADFYGLTKADFPDFLCISLVGVEDTELVMFDGPKLIKTGWLHWLDYMIVRHRLGGVGLDTIAHFFGGEEVRRRDVARFTRALDGISLGRDCPFIFTAHPSLSGRNSGTMESGSTQWEGGVRSRLKWEEIEPDENAPTDKTIRRRLTRAKSNYAETGVSIDLVLRNGGFIPEAVDPETAKLRQAGPGRNAACEDKFLELLGKVRVPDYVHKSANSPGRYAPAVFAKRSDGKQFSRPEYERAMTRLEVAGRLQLEPVGSPSRERTRLVEAHNHE
jgi:RecA-family ATPase